MPDLAALNERVVELAVAQAPADDPLGARDPIPAPCVGLGRVDAPDLLEDAQGPDRLVVHALRVLVARDIIPDEARWERVAVLVEH
eukprot:12225214-Alexandrium_andersonii.AAC.1